MPRYQCHKEVFAFKIHQIIPGDTDARLALSEGPEHPVTLDWLAKHKPQVGGYLVLYEDGYTSYSPAEPFEKGYTRIDHDFSNLRKLTSHVVNPANDKIEIFVLDGPGPGGANHEYFLRWTGKDGKTSNTLIHFQNGAINEAGVNGLTHEALLAIIEDRLVGFQSGPYACEENEMALNQVRGSQNILKRRTRERMERGVEGTLQK